MEKLKNLYEKYREIIQYIIFGVTTTIVNWVVYILLGSVIGLELTLTNAIAWVIAVMYAFLTNRHFVFQSKETSFVGIMKEMFLFFMARGATGLIEIFFPTLLFAIGLNQTVCGIKAFYAKLIVSVVVIVLNYVLSKLIVFRKKA